MTLGDGVPAALTSLADERRSHGLAVLMAGDQEQKVPLWSIKPAAVSLPSLPCGHSQAAGGTQPWARGSSVELGQGAAYGRGGSSGLSYPALGSALSHMSTVSVTLGITLLPHGRLHAAGGREGG